MWLLRLSATKPYVFTIHVVLAFHFVVANDFTFHELAINRTFHQLVAIDKCCSVQRVLVFLLCLHSIDWKDAGHLEHFYGVVESVNLPFVFQWRGQVNYTQVVVKSNSYVYPGSIEESLFIDIGYQDFDPSIVGNIYAADVDGVFVILWEGVPQNGGLPENGLNLQVTLYPGGNIEICWGNGNPPTDQDAFGFAGIRDEAGVVVPATRFPFDNDAYGFGAAPSFPSNQCQTFVVTAMGNYTELPWT